ncbi:hypothetical protein F4777DRAFT_563651 [Nemania sp. FL0916]|nr:hypothetical protein F4777DRAFT_563651 [Nemania sp. FL0916]
MLAAVAMEHLEEIVANKFLEDTNVVRDFSPYMMPKCISMLFEMKGLNESANASYRAASQRTANTLADLNKCRSLLEKWDSCRNCKAEFNCYLDVIDIDELSSSPKYLLRCTNCRCRHR